MTGLQLRTIVTIAPEPLEPLAGLEHINYVHILNAGEKSKSKKKRGLPITAETVDAVLQIIMDQKHHPVYLHCLNGAQVTCLVVGCYRRLHDWSVNSILAEFSRFTDYDRVDTVFIQAYRMGAAQLEDTPARIELV